VIHTLNRIAMLVVLGTTSIEAQAPSVKAAYKYDLMLDSTDGVYSGFGMPVIDPSGRIVVSAAQGTFQELIIRTDGSVVERLAESGGAFVDLDAEFGISRMQARSGDTVLFGARLNTGAKVVMKSAGGVLSEVFSQDTLPVPSSQWGQAVPREWCMNEAGDFACIASNSTGLGLSAVYTNIAGFTQTVAYGDGNTGNGTPFIDFSYLDMFPDGSLALAERRKDRPAPYSGLTWLGSGATIDVTELPFDPSFFFSVGTSGFIAYLDHAAVYQGRIGGAFGPVLGAVGCAGGPPSVGITAMRNSRTLAFTARDCSGQGAVFCGLPGAYSKVVVDGQMFFGRIVQDASIGREAVNSRGQVAINLALVHPTTLQQSFAILRATPRILPR